MKKLLLIGVFLIAVITVSSQSKFHQFKIKDIDGKEFDFASLKGKKVMVVNTASKCSSTKQYEMLQVLYEKYSDSNFIVIGFPANNFHNTEPGITLIFVNFVP